MSDFHLVVDLDDSRPAYAQIEQQVRALIATRTWRPGDQVPSVRETATRLRLNPLTVSKAYRLLQEEGLLESKPGAGIYVSEKIFRSSPRHDVVRDKFRQIVESSHLSVADLRSLFEEALVCSRLN